MNQSALRIDKRILIAMDFSNQHRITVNFWWSEQKNLDSELQLKKKRKKPN